MKIYNSISINDLNLRNRIVMAPLTRGFADNITGEVNNLIVDYYKRRARYEVGLIISEGILINNTAKGSYGIPGLFTEKQVEAWKKVTTAVHEENGIIFAQLWHVGRLSHSKLLNNMNPISPSATIPKGYVHRLGIPYEASRSVSRKEIFELINDYKVAAQNALKAGFDGIEIHAAHGYLIDQFINEKTNLRKDDFGGNIENRLRLLSLVLNEVTKVISPDKISVRISEKKDDDTHYYWTQPEETLKSIISVLNKFDIRILHISANDYFTHIKNHDQTIFQLARKYWPNILIGVGNISPSEAEKIIENNELDLVAFGRPFLGNPDLVIKMKSRQNINLYQYDINNLY